MSVPDAQAAFVRLAFAAQPPLAWLQAELVAVDDGTASIAFPVRDDLCTVGTGLVMGGVCALAADVAAGLALLTRLDPPRPIVTTGMSAHQIGPARGERILCVGSVLKIGRTQGLARAEIYAVTGDERRHAATVTASFAIP